MKKYLFHLFYGILVFMVASCTNSESPKSPNFESFNDSNVSISIDEARNELNQLLLDQETAYSRAGVDSKRVIESFYTRSLNPGSRSEKSDFEVYVFNFADNKGFAIMSTDKRTPSLLALAENGNLSDTTEIDNPGFNMYINLLSMGDI
jgi:Peptidase C10 family.